MSHAAAQVQAVVRGRLEREQLKRQWDPVFLRAENEELQCKLAIIGEETGFWCHFIVEIHYLPR